VDKSEIFGNQATNSHLISLQPCFTQIVHICWLLSKRINIHKQMNPKLLQKYSLLVKC